MLERCSNHMMGHGIPTANTSLVISMMGKSLSRTSIRNPFEVSTSVNSLVSCFSLRKVASSACFTMNLAAPAHTWSTVLCPVSRCCPFTFNVCRQDLPMSRAISLTFAAAYHKSEFSDVLPGRCCLSGSAWDDFGLSGLLRHHLTGIYTCAGNRAAGPTGHLPLVGPQLLAIRGADQESENLSRPRIPLYTRPGHLVTVASHLQVIVKVPFRCLICTRGRTPMQIWQTQLELSASSRCLQYPGPTPFPNPRPCRNTTRRPTMGNRKG